MGSFATTQVLSLEGHFGPFQTSQSAQTSVIKDSKWWGGGTYLSCFPGVFGALLRSVCLLMWERKETLDWFETCELTLILVKIKLAFLVFACVIGVHGKLGEPWQEWEFSQWNDSKTEKTSAVVSDLPAALLLQQCRQVATLRSVAY